MECNFLLNDNNCQKIYERLNAGNGNPLAVKIGEKISFSNATGIHDADLNIHAISSTFQKDKLKYVDYCISGICSILKSDVFFKLRVQKNYHKEIAQLLYLNPIKEEKLNNEVMEKLYKQNGKFILDKDQDEVPIENPRTYWLSDDYNQPLTADVQTNEIASTQNLSVSRMSKMQFWTYTRKTKDSSGKESQDFLIIELDVGADLLSTFVGTNISFSDLKLI